MLLLTVVALAEVPLSDKCARRALDDCQARAEAWLATDDPEAHEVGRGMLEKACRMRHAPACEARGLLAVDAASEPAELGVAIGWFEQGCALDLGTACNRAGTLRVNAPDPLRDPDAALDLTVRACDLGTMLGCINAGDLLRSTELGPHDPDRALALLIRACDAGEARGCNQLGVFLAEDVGDDAAALVAVARSCELGHARGCINGYELTPQEGEGWQYREWAFALRGCGLRSLEACDRIGYGGPLDGPWTVSGALDGEMVVAVDSPCAVETWTFAGRAWSASCLDAAGAESTRSGALERVGTVFRLHDEAPAEGWRLPPSLQLLRHWTDQGAPCEGDACRVPAVAARDDGVLWVSSPVGAAE